jgi:WD40 repeat protein
MVLGKERLVKCSLTDGSILKDYTSMLYDPIRPTGIPAEIWNILGPNSQEENQINDIAATSDHKWLFVACQKGWWAIFDLQQDKCVSRKHCTIMQSGQIPRPFSVAVSPDDQLLYMVTTSGTVESYDIQAAKAGQMKSIPNQCFIKITVDSNNKFVFIASSSGNLYKYDSG